jgi:hypothetical protein
MNISIGGKHTSLPFGLYIKAKETKSSLYENIGGGMISEQIHSSFIDKMMNKKTKKNTTRKKKQRDQLTRKKE